MVDLIPTKEEWNRALSERYGENIKNRLSSAVVAICGLGGLGSNIAIALARAGVGKLILVDYDTVDITNLHRQQYKALQIGMNKTEALRDIILEISPYTELEINTVRLTEENTSSILDNADIICEAFDAAECKAMLANLVLETMPDKYLVAASGMAGFGSANTIRTRRITSRFYLCGDEQSDVRAEGSLVVSRVMLCAAHQAHTVLRILTERFET